MSEPLARHQILLFRGDIDRLREFYTIRSASEVIRTLLRQHLDRLEAEVARKQEPEHVQG